MRIDGPFFNVEDLVSLAKKMKETMKYRVFPMVYRLVEFTLLFYLLRQHLLKEYFLL